MNTSKRYLLLLIIAGACIATLIARMHVSPQRFQGLTAAEWLRAFSTNSTNAEDILIPHQVLTGEEPGTITFEVPLSFDVIADRRDLGRIGKLSLYVDGVYCVPMAYRATNGNCRLAWNSQLYEIKSGQHTLQLKFYIGGRSGTRLISADGRQTSFVVPTYPNRVKVGD